MKKIIAVLVLASTFSLASAQPFRKIQNKAFDRGEKFTFRVYYDSFVTGKVTAGEASIEVKNEVKIIGGRPTYHVEALGKSKGAFNFFFKVNNRYETYIDEEALIPWLFLRRTKEGDYEINDDITFDHYKNIAISRRKTKSIPDNVQDIISSFYWARNIDISKAKYGDEFPFKFYLDDSTYTSKIVYLGKEEIKISTGTYKTIKIKPMVATGNVFDDQYPMVIWVSDDENRIPLLGKSEIIVGSVKMELVSYSGLRNSNVARLH